MFVFTKVEDVFQIIAPCDFPNCDVSFQGSLISFKDQLPPEPSAEEVTRIFLGADRGRFCGHRFGLHQWLKRGGRVGGSLETAWRFRRQVFPSPNHNTICSELVLYLKESQLQHKQTHTHKIWAEKAKNQKTFY